MRHWIKLSALTLAVVVAAACASQKQPAETALKAAESAWAAVSADATKYMATEAKGISDAIETAKGEFTKGNYEAVLKEATALPAKIADLQKALAQKKSEWTSAWTSLEGTLGSSMGEVQAKVNELAKARRLPAGIDKAAVEGAKTALTAAQQAFDEAKAAYQNADYEAALAKANQVKADVTKVVTDLKLTIPALTGTPQ